MDDLPLDIGVVYIPFMADKWDRCTPGEPSIGEYGIDDSFAVNRHIDQMQGHGITTLMFNYGEGRKDFDRVRAFLDAELSSEIAIETMWVIKKVFTRDLDIDLFMEFARENLLSLPNHRTIDGRPVVQLVGSNFIPWDDSTANEVKERWGGFEEFAEYLRLGLTVDGIQPYFVSSITDVPDSGLSEDEAEWNKQFEAVTTWFPNPRVDEESPWNWYLSRAKGDFEVLTEFANKNDLDLIPTAFPGRDERFNTCWGNNPFVSRHPSHLEDMLTLSDQFRTLNRINIATYNDWVEGHQIEPGEWPRTDYGTDYLQKVKKMQVGHSSTSSQTPTATPSIISTSTPPPKPTAPPSPTSTEKPSESSIVSSSQSSTNGRYETNTSAQSPGFGVLSALVGVGSIATYLCHHSKRKD